MYCVQYGIISITQTTASLMANGKYNIIILAFGDQRLFAFMGCAINFFCLDAHEHFGLLLDRVRVMFCARSLIFVGRTVRHNATMKMTALINICCSIFERI